MKKSALYFSLILTACALLNGCAGVNYFGDKYPPSSKVIFYYSEKDVPVGTYKVMGRGTIIVNPLFSEGVVETFRDKARDVGADAVLIKGFVEFKKPEKKHDGHSHHHHDEEKHELRAEFLKKILP